MAEARPRRRRLPLKKRLLFLGILLGAFLLLVEVAGRLAGMPSGAMRTTSKVGIQDRATYERTIGMWQPGFRGRILWPPELAFSVGINSLGFRGPEVARARPADTARILCLGDSTTFCIYADDERTYPRQLEARLRESGAAVEVINGGSPGWGTRAQAEFLEGRALGVSPTLVLHMFELNDYQDSLAEDAGRGKYNRQLARATSGFSLDRPLRGSTAIGELITRIGFEFKAMREPKKHRGKVDPQALTPPEAPDEAAAAALDAAFADLAAACKARGVPLVSTLFPNPRLTYTRQLAAEQRLAALAQGHGVPFLRLCERTGASKDLASFYNFPWDYHASEAGNAWIAGLIAQDLEDRKLGPYAE